MLSLPMLLLPLMELPLQLRALAPLKGSGLGMGMGRFRLEKGCFVRASSSPAANVKVAKQGTVCCPVMHDRGRTVLISDPLQQIFRFSKQIQTIENKAPALESCPRLAQGTV